MQLHKENQTRTRSLNDEFWVIVWERSDRSHRVLFWLNRSYIFWLTINDTDKYSIRRQAIFKHRKNTFSSRFAYSAIMHLDRSRYCRSWSSMYLWRKNLNVYRRCPFSVSVIIQDDISLNLLTMYKTRTWYSLDMIISWMWAMIEEKPNWKVTIKIKLW